MNQDIFRLLQEKNTYYHQNTGVTLCTITDSNEGIALAKDILYKYSDRKSAIYLSGGKTPKSLYEEIAQDGMLTPGCVGMIDERFGQKLHPASNELMLKNTEILRYFELSNMPFFPILNSEAGDRESIADKYDQQLRSLHTIYQKHIGIMGIGKDGHTAGIAPERDDFHNPLFDEERKNVLVSEFNDAKGPFKERITMTFLGLSLLDFFLVLVFGEDKKKALKKMFEPGNEKAIPARFYLRPNIASKTLLITDISV